MELEYNRLYDNIFKRVSTRDFSNHEIEDTVFNKIKIKAEEINKVDSNFKIIVVPEADDSIYKGIIGSYGKIKGAPAYAVFIGKKNDKEIMQKVGYLGEMFILDILSDNISTCWLSGTINRDNISKNINLEDDFEIYAITPLGYASDSNNAAHTLIKMMLNSSNRKDIKEITNLGEVDAKTEWMSTISEAVRRGPSARNLQPWYLEFKEEQVILKSSIDSSINGSKVGIDIGIAKLHLQLGLLKCGINYNYDTSSSNNEIVFEIVS